MSQADSKNLSNEKIQQLLAAIGAESEEDIRQNAKAIDYNWQEPRRFNDKQLEKLDIFTKQVAQACAEKFAHLYHSSFNVTIASTSQHFAGEITASAQAQADYYLCFGADKDHPFGLIGIPRQTAIIWAKQLLGDSKSAENSDKDLSQLEESLLRDLAFRLIEAFSTCYKDCDLQSAKCFVKGQLPLELNGTEEFFRITFKVNEDESEDISEAYFLILSDKLDTVVGQNIQADKNLSAKNVAEMMLNHVHKVTVSITAQLARTVLTFDEIISLQVGDILLLDKGINEATELTIEGKTMLRGQPVKSDGMHAVLIRELCNTK